MRFPSFQCILADPRPVSENIRTSGGFRGRDSRRRPGRASAAVLLEVILALGLFVAAAALLGAALTAAIDGVDRQRLQTHAGNLAVSVLSEIQLGIRSATESSATPFAPPFDQWTAQVTQTPAETETGEASGAMLVEVIIRHADPPMTHRLAQMLRPVDAPKLEAPLAMR